MRKTILIFAIILMATGPAFAQTYSKQELQRMYWNFRDRLDKNFIHIGSEVGQSIPFETLKPNFSVPPKNYDTANPSLHPIIKGMINYGDANITHGWYLAVLATEYKLLKDAGASEKERQKNRNELYYALSAINRIDRYSNTFFDPLADFDLQIEDGFLTRGDVTQDFYKLAKKDNAGFSQNYQWVHSDMFNGVDIVHYNDTTKECTAADGSIFDAGDQIERIKHPMVGYDPNGHGTYGTYGAEYSQDHYIGLLFGLYFIHKFVDNDFVKPTLYDSSFNLLDETRAIVTRLTDNFANRKDADVITPTNDFDGDVVRLFDIPWTILNPGLGKVPERGPTALRMGLDVGMEAVAEEIIGEDRWDVASGHYSYQNSTSEDEKYAIILDQEEKWDNELTVQATGQNEHRIIGDDYYYGKNIYNFNMLFKLGVCSQLYSLTDIGTYANYDYQLKGAFWGLMYKVLKGDISTNAVDDTTIYSYLDQTMGRIGCGDISNDEVLTFKDPTLYMEWKHENKFNMHGGSEGDHDQYMQKGQFNALDFMLLYNLTKLYYPDKLNDQYKNSACPCGSGMVKDAIADDTGAYISALSAPFKTDEKNKSYRAMKIQAPEWLTHDLTINSGGHLKVQGDLWVCDSSTTTLQNSGTLSFTDTINEFERTIVYRSGSVLEIKSDGRLKIGTNSRVLIEEGAKLVINPGAKVYLNGLTAVLEIQGKIEIKGGATFTPLTDSTHIGYIKFHHDWDSDHDSTTDDYNVTSNGSGNKIVLIGTANNTSTKLLEVTGNIGLNTDWGLAEFKIINGHADMGKASCISANSANNQFKNFWMRRLGTDYHGGIHLHGRTNRIHNARIEYANNGVTFLNIGTKESLNLDSLTFNHCKTSIRQWGGGINFNEGWIEVPGDTVLSARGCETLSKIFGVDAESASASTFGFNYFGSNVLRMNHNTVNGFSYGVNMIDAQLYLSCNQFNYNKYNSIKTNSSLYISQGYNTFNAYSANTSGLQSDIKINNSGTLWMKYGNNYFYGSKNLIKASLKKNQPKVYEPFLPPSNPFHFALEADSNNFESSPVGAPLSGYKYLLSCTGIGDGKLKNFKVSPSYYTNSYYASRKGAYCAEVIWTGSLHPKGAIPVMPGLFTDNYQFPVTDRDPLTSTHVQYYDTVFRTWMNFFLVNTKENVMDKTLISSTSYDVPIDSMKVILSAYNLPSYVNQSKIGYLSVYQMMHDAVAKAVYEKVVTVPSSGAIAPIIRKALVAQQALYTTSLSSSYFWNDYRYMILKDWAQLYRLAERRDSAMVILNLASAVLTNPAELMGIDRWKCTNEAEMYYLAHPVPYDTLVKMYPCQYDDSTDLDSSGFEPPPSMQLANKQLELKKSILIYPNPTSDILNIELKTADSKEIMLSVTITDLQGKTIATLQPKSGKTTFNTSALPAGVYAVKVSTEKGSYSQTVNVIH